MRRDSTGASTGSLWETSILVWPQLALYGATTKGSDNEGLEYQHRRLMSRVVMEKGPYGRHLSFGNFGMCGCKNP